jgi:hypothetical protein
VPGIKNIAERAVPNCEVPEIAEEFSLVFTAAIGMVESMIQTLGPNIELLTCAEALFTPASRMIRAKLEHTQLLRRDIFMVVILVAGRLIQLRGSNAVVRLIKARRLYRGRNGRQVIR